MKVKIKYFAYYESLIGKNEEVLQIEDKTTVGDLFDQIIPVKTSTLFAVNLKYVERDHILREGDEVAFIPPVAGG